MIKGYFFEFIKNVEEKIREDEREKFNKKLNKIRYYFELMGWKFVYFEIEEEFDDDDDIDFIDYSWLIPPEIYIEVIRLLKYKNTLSIVCQKDVEYVIEKYGNKIFDINNCSPIWISKNTKGLK